MIKGCQRRMVIVSGLRDSEFEAAYFIMREPIGEKNDRDILEMANSIIERCYTDTVDFKKASKDEKKKKEKKSAVCFISGFFSGLAFFAIAAAFISLLS